MMQSGNKMLFESIQKGDEKAFNKAFDYNVVTVAP